MNVGSLFTGIGGFDLGLERAGHTIAWQCEADEWRRGVLAAHWPDVECSPDVRDVRLDEGSGRGRVGHDESAAGRLRRIVDEPGACAVDLLCGGFPCQDLSVAGRRAGLAGTRSGLFYEFARIADLVLPPGGWILVENVPGLLSSQSGRDFAVVLATLADLGFHDLAWRVLDSRHFGVAQRRRRVYILARRARGERACQVLLEPEGGGGDPQTRGEAGPGVAVASLSGLGSGGPDDNDGQAGRIVTAPARVKRYGKGTDSDATDCLIADTLTSGSHPASNMPGRRREDDTNIVPSLTRAMGNNAAHPGNGGLDELASVAAANGAGVRRLTPVECERLQGFPDGWTAHGADSRRYAALGDAVTVNVAEWIGRRLMEVA